MNTTIAADEYSLGAVSVRHPTADRNEHRERQQIAGDRQIELSGSSLSDAAMDGSAVVITAPSNWCMNCAQPTMSGTMVEVREAVMGGGVLEFPEIRSERIMVYEPLSLLCVCIPQ